MELPAEDAMTWLEALAASVLILVGMPLLAWLAVTLILGG